MSYDRYRVSIEPLENGFAVEVPDMAAIAKKQADAKKKNNNMPTDCYIGDCTSKYAAKSTKEVLKIVQTALEKLPDGEYDAAFDEAAKNKK
jgi:hypothetical protein